MKGGIDMDKDINNEHINVGELIESILDSAMILAIHSDVHSIENIDEYKEDEE